MSAGDKVEELPFDPMMIVRNAPSMRWTRDGVENIGPLDEDLPDMLRQINGSVGRDLITLVGVLWGSTSQLFNRIGPLQTVADQMPTIVANSDHVHDELKQGLAAIQTAVGSIQQASTNLGTSLTSIAQLAAQAQASAAIANANATAAGQRCASLEARTTTLETKVANHEARIAALEARKVQTWRAAGNLPTLALNGTIDVTCAWTSPAPTTMPALEQCQAFIAGSAIPTVKSVSASGVVVTLKAAASLLPAPAAVQVMATTFN